MSPGQKNKRRDYADKTRMYAKAGIPTFLRIELTGADAPRVEVLTLRDGDYALVSAGEVLQLKEPFEVSFDPAEPAELAGPRRR